MDQKQSIGNYCVNNHIVLVIIKHIIGLVSKILAFFVASSVLPVVHHNPIPYFYAIDLLCKEHPSATVSFLSCVFVITKRQCRSPLILHTTSAFRSLNLTIQLKEIVRSGTRSNDLYHWVLASSTFSISRNQGQKINVILT